MGAGPEGVSTVGVCPGGGVRAENCRRRETWVAVVVAVVVAAVVVVLVE